MQLLCFGNWACRTAGSVLFEVEKAGLGWGWKSRVGVQVLTCCLGMLG